MGKSGLVVAIEKVDIKVHILLYTLPNMPSWAFLLKQLLQKSQDLLL